MDDESNDLPPSSFWLFHAPHIILIFPPACLMEKLVFVPPPIIALLLIGLAFGVDCLLPKLPLLRLPGLGILLMATGFFLGITALLNFRRHRTTFVPHGNPTVLVTRGSYIWTRNPMYLGLFTALLGFACYFGNLLLFLVPLAFFLIIDRHHIPYEEAKLLQLFGDDYGEFRQQVARWL
jgi:protein-S-isoprenylcysteine O-methyltransferase Ste14